MTRIDRLHIEATIAALDALSFLVGGGVAADGLRAHRVALRQALDADPAPRECDPYPLISRISSIFPPNPNTRDQQQYNADPAPAVVDPYPMLSVPATICLQIMSRADMHAGLNLQYDADAPKDPT